MYIWFWLIKWKYCNNNDGLNNTLMKLYVLIIDLFLNFYTEIFETKCSFPLWLTENQKWRTLDHGKTFTFPHHHNNNTLKLVSSSLDHVFAAQTIQASHQFFYNQPLVAPLPGHEMKFSCQQEMEELPHRFRVMAHYVTGW